MTGSFVSVEKGIQLAGVGKFQYRLFVIFGLVWLADAMQVLSIGFSAPVSYTHLTLPTICSV